MRQQGENRSNLVFSELHPLLSLPARPGGVTGIDQLQSHLLVNLTEHFANRNNVFKERRGVPRRRWLRMCFWLSSRRAKGGFWLVMEDPSSVLSKVLTRDCTGASLEECFDLNPCNEAAAAAMPWCTPPSSSLDAGNVQLSS